MKDLNQVHDWEAFKARIRELTGARTQVEMATLLGIRQSSISDAKRRGTCPPEWQMQFVRNGLNPVWILTGEGPKFLLASEDGVGVAPGAVLEAMRPMPEPEGVAERMQALGADIARMLPGHSLGLFVLPTALASKSGRCLVCGGEGGEHKSACPLSGLFTLPYFGAVRADVAQGGTA